MATPARILYASQNAIIYPNSGSTGTSYALALNSVSVDITNPIENVLTFGTLGAAARVQKEPSKTKISLKSYLTSGYAGGGGATDFGATAITTLTGYALQGQYSKIVVEPYGYTGYGILTSLGLDASTNNFVTLDLSFEGLGSPDFAGIPTGIGAQQGYAGLLPIITGVTPVTSNLVAAGVTSNDPLFSGAPGTNITAGVVGNCVTSAKFSLDIPTDTVMCLGSVITGSQAIVAAGNVMLAKPPFKTSLVVEGTAATACDTVDFGTVLVRLPVPRLVSNSVNQAVGNVGQTYNYTVEDLTAVFSASALFGGTQPTITGG